MVKPISSRYIQGFFQPLHPEKCLNKSKARYLSSYELKFMRWADKNPNVLKWGSECIQIPYANPITGRTNRYFVDNFILLKNKNGSTTKYLIELKPSKQTQPPNTKNRKNKKALLFEQLTYAQNQAKWTAAQQWCQKHGYKFLVLTEKELGIHK